MSSFLLKKFCGRMREKETEQNLVNMKISEDAIGLLKIPGRQLTYRCSSFREHIVEFLYGLYTGHRFFRVNSVALGLLDRFSQVSSRLPFSGILRILIHIIYSQILDFLGFRSRFSDISNTLRSVQFLKTF